MIKAIVFDMDGVIFDTEQLFISCWKALGDEINLPDLEEVLRMCIGTNIEKTREIITTHYGEKLDYDRYQVKVREMFFKHVTQYGMPMKRGVHEILDYLKQSNYKIGLASSTAVEKVKSELKSVGIDQAFEVIVGGDMVTHSKPHPEIYEVACARLGVKPEEAIAIEDSLNGIRSAYGAGLKPIMVPDLVAPTKEIESLLYKKMDSLLEVRDFLIGKEQNSLS